MKNECNHPEDWTCPFCSPHNMHFAKGVMAAKRDFVMIAKHALTIIQLILSIAVIAWILVWGIPQSIQRNRQINETQARIEAMIDSMK